MFPLPGESATQLGREGSTPLLQGSELAMERARLTAIARESKVVLIRTIIQEEWCNKHEKSGVVCSVAPSVGGGIPPEFRAMGSTVIRRPPHSVYEFIIDMKSRPAWDKILNEHKIVDEFTKDANHRTCLWTMKFRPRYLKMKRRVTVLACYCGVHPQEPGGYMVSYISVVTPLAPVGDDEVSCHIPVSGYCVVPHPSNPAHSVVTYVIRITIQQHLLGFMERTLMRTISQWGPPFAIIDRLNTLRGLIEEKCLLSVVTTFPYARESNFPPQFLRDFSYIKTDPVQTRDDVIRYYCGDDNEDKWKQVTSERGLVMKRFEGPLLHERHNLALKLTFSTSNFIQFTLCLTDTDKRLIWEPCATRVEHIWDDGPMNICLKVVGGGPAKGRGCPKFELFVYHIYSYGLHGDGDVVDSCVFEEHSDGNILLVLLSAKPNSNTQIDIFFFVNTNNYADRSNTSLNFLPSSPLDPVARTLLESVIEFRNVIELDTWLPSESIERLSLLDLAKSATSNRNSTELVSPHSQKRKQQLNPPEEEAPLFRKVRNYFNKLPSFSSVFGNNTPPPPPPTRSRPPSLHLLFASQPPSKLTYDLFNRLPYEILVHIFKFLAVEDVFPCSQVCHRTWQVANLDVVWRDLIAIHTAKEKEAQDNWDKYTPCVQSAGSPSNIREYRSHSFDVKILTSAGSSSDLSADYSSRSSSWGTIDDAVCPQGLENSLNLEQKRRTLKEYITDVEGYASSLKLEYLHGLAAKQCWKYGVSSYVPCGTLRGSQITCLSENERDDTLLVACRSGVVRGISPADMASPSSRVLFSLPASQQPAIQAQWREDSIGVVFSDGEMVEYDVQTKEEKSRRFFAPLSGGFLYHPPSASSITMLVTHLRSKVRVFGVESTMQLMKWVSSRGDITSARANSVRCIAATSMHALYTVNVIDMTTNSLLACLSGHQDQITGVRLLDQQGNLITSSSKDGTVRVWDLRAGTQAAMQYSHTPGLEVNCFYTVPDKLVVGLSSGEVAYWDPRNINKSVASFALPATVKRENMSINNVHITQDQKRLVATWDSGLFSTWILYPR